MSSPAHDLALEAEVQTDVCPWCEQPISRKEFERIQARIREEQAAKLAEVKRSLAAEQQRKIREAAERLKAEAEKEKLKAVEEAKKEAAEAAATDLKSTKEALEQASAEKKEIEENLERLQEGADEARNEAVSAAVKAAVETANEEHRRELLKQRELLAKDAEKAATKKEAENRKDRERLEKKVRDMHRQLEGKRANELGDGAEVDLFEDLRNTFPEDRIERVKKGKQGADIRHEVIEGGEVCGVILYDSKSHKAWRNSFVKKLRTDQVNDEADYGVLTALQFPSGEKEFCVRESVLVVSPARAVALVAILRSAIVQMHGLRLSGAERSTKSERVYEYLRSEAFGLHLRRADELAEEILDIDVEEQKAHKRVWRKRGEAARALSRQLTELNTEIQSLMRE